MQHLRILYINALREKRINRGVQKVGPGKSSNFSELLNWLILISWEPKGTPQRNKALLRDYQPFISLHKALLGPILGGVALSHDRVIKRTPSTVSPKYQKNATKNCNLLRLRSPGPLGWSAWIARSKERENSQCRNCTTNTNHVIPSTCWYFLIRRCPSAKGLVIIIMIIIIIIHSHSCISNCSHHPAPLGIIGSWDPQAPSAAHVSSITGCHCTNPNMEYRQIHSELVLHTWYGNKNLILPFNWMTSQHSSFFTHLVGGSRKWLYARFRRKKTTAFAKRSSMDVSVGHMRLAFCRIREAFSASVTLGGEGYVVK